MAIFENNILITGISQNNNLNNDFYTLNLDSAGTEIWNNRYNYDNAEDLAIDIQINNNNVIITGVSGNQFNDYNYTLVSLALDDGSLINDERVDNGNIGFDIPVDVAKDLNDNIFVTGNSKEDFLTVKFDSLLNIVDSVRFNSQNLDSVKGILIDDSANVYVFGNCLSDFGYFYTKIIKYNNFLDSVWERDIKLSNSSNFKAQTGLIKNDKIILGINSDSYLYHAGCNIFGNTLWAKKFDTDFQKSMPITVFSSGANKFAISSKFFNGEENLFGLISVDYEVFETDSVTNPNGSPHWVDDEFIVRFNPNEVKLNLIENKNTEFARLDSILKPSAYSTILNNIGELTNFELLTFSKLYPNMEIGDTLAETIWGDTIKTKKLWSSFIVRGNNINEKVLSQAFNNQFPVVYYSNLNSIGNYNWTPNDPELPNQINLISNGFNNFHLDMEKAWDIEKGSSLINVCIVDGEINSNFKDFNDFQNKFPENYQVISSSSQNPGHGTGVSSNIGSISNNNFGISGIAGGDYEQNNPGVSLFGLDIFDNNKITLKLSSALIGYEYALDFWNINLFNNSWGIRVDDPSFVNNFQSLYEQLEVYFYLGIPIVASRGNFNNSNHQFPATFSDPIIISVGGGNVSSGQFQNNLSFGRNVDIISPTSAITVGGFGATNSNYIGSIGNSSASASNVSGLAALILSYYNNKVPMQLILTNEDIEALIEFYATDANDPGYDQYAGHGFINAFETLKHIVKPTYSVQKFGFSKNLSDKVLVNSNHTLKLNVGYESQYSSTVIQAGEYVCEVYKLSGSTNYFLGTNESMISTQKNGNHVWARNNVSDLFEYANEIFPTPGCKITSSNYHSVNMEGYQYKILYNVNNPSVALNQWLPDLGNKTPYFGFSVHTYTDFTSGENNLTNSSSITTFPNPVTNYFQIAGITEKVNIEIFNNLGEIIYYQSNITAPNYRINTTDWTKGTYFVKIKGNQTNASFKQLILP